MNFVENQLARVTSKKERKPGYVNLKIDGWFTKKQIIDNYEMLIKELDEWKVNEDGIRWKYK